MSVLWRLNQDLDDVDKALRWICDDDIDDDDIDDCIDDDDDDDDIDDDGDDDTNEFEGSDALRSVVNLLQLRLIRFSTPRKWPGAMNLLIGRKKGRF